MAARRHCLLSNVLFYSEYEGDPATHLASVRKFLGDSFSFAFTDQNSESKEEPKQAGGGGRSPAGLSQMERSALRAAIVRLADSAVAGLYARSVQVQTDLLHDGSVRRFAAVLHAPSCCACSAAISHRSPDRGVRTLPRHFLKGRLVQSFCLVCMRP